MLELQRLYDDLEAAAAPRSSGMTMVEAIGFDTEARRNTVSASTGSGR